MPGNDSYGTVFEISAGGAFSVLHSFAPGTNDGAVPQGPVLADDEGNTYGTTSSGSSSSNSVTGYNPSGYGTIFKIDRNGVESILHSFDSADGASPIGSLVRDFAGNLYGVTLQGGSAGKGTVYRLDRIGRLNVLHTFGERAGDGLSPTGGLVMDLAGNLFGMTSAGGSSNMGTIYMIDRAGRETVLHSFDAKTGSPNGELTMDDRGRLYGSASGSTENDGVVFAFGTEERAGWGERRDR